MLNFWLVAVLCATVTFQIQDHYKPSTSRRRCVCSDTQLLHLYTLLLISLLLSALSDQPPLFSEASKDANPCPEIGASFLSRISFWWITGLIVTGYKRPLEQKDLWCLNSEDRSQRVVPQLVRRWNNECLKVKRPEEKTLYSPKKAPRGERKEGVPVEESEILIMKTPQKTREPSLFWALCLTFGPYFLISALYKIIQDVLMFVGPNILRLLIQFVNDSSAPSWQGYFYTALLFVCTCFQTLILQKYFHVCFVTGMRLRTAIVGAVYRKALVISNAARRTSTVGEIVNLMSVDAQRFMDLITYINMVWSAPLQVILALYFLWQPDELRRTQPYELRRTQPYELRRTQPYELRRTHVRLRRRAVRAETDAAVRAETDAARRAETDAARRAETDAAVRAEDGRSPVRAETDAAVRAETDAAVRAETDPARRAETDAARRAETDAARRAETEQPTSETDQPDAETDAARRAETARSRRAETDAADELRRAQQRELRTDTAVLKLYAWELAFKDKVSAIRESELRVLKKAAYLGAISTFTWVCAPFLVALSTFTVYVMIDERNVLDAQKAFVSLALFNILRFPLNMLPMVISSMVQVGVLIRAETSQAVTTTIDRYAKHDTTEQNENPYELKNRQQPYERKRDADRETETDASRNLRRTSSQERAEARRRHERRTTRKRQPRVQLRDNHQPRLRTHLSETQTVRAEESLTTALRAEQRTVTAPVQPETETQPYRNAEDDHAERAAEDAARTS
ncbi:multidrug resistance-associated protein 1-like [Salvelinus sp. IW2-2015]|uniref:multidrug resistance-associated protein 1-like n=1 Tax=Salvelinus sp. IW2-2015 TaxID=2691554 RepID=UPI0038D43368